MRVTIVNVSNIVNPRSHSKCTRYSESMMSVGGEAAIYEIIYTIDDDHTIP